MTRSGFRLQGVPISPIPSRDLAALAKVLLAAMLVLASPALAADQSVPGAGGAAAITLAGKSPLIQSAFRLALTRAGRIKNPQVRTATVDAIGNPRTCVRHRANLSIADRKKIVDQLVGAGLADPQDGKSFPGGLLAGIFPPLTNDGGACPHLPSPFYAAPGSFFHGHHSYPGGLAVHEMVNDLSFEALADNYRRVFGNPGDSGLPEVRPSSSVPGLKANTIVTIDEDIVIAAPLWHDWGKTIVLQWNADGSEFQELDFGGNGKTDAWGGDGNSKTGAHHIIGVAEAMARGMPPAFVIAQASAHASPSLGNEYKVVNWMRAAATIARIDPVAKGYLYTDAYRKLRLPPLRRLGEVDLLDASPMQSNLLAEYALHNLSDADYTFSMPSVGAVEILLQRLAPEFGMVPGAGDYNLRYRNPALSYLSAERLMMLYGNGGLDAVRKELAKLSARSLIPAPSSARH